MPIYIESKGIGFIGNTYARHEYVVYVPVGEELNYAAWRLCCTNPVRDSSCESSVESKTAQNETLIATATMRQVAHAEKRLTGSFPLPKS